MKNYKNEIIDFSKQLGVLPIYFMHNQQDDSKYVLLNGEKNNFCIDFKNEFDKDLYRNYAWSANVNNFLSIKEDKCLLYSINDKDPEIINYRTMVSHLSKFYDYLGAKNTNRNETVISYILKTYRQLRNALRETSGNDSLRAFLYLLSSIESDNVNLGEWGLPEQSKTIADTISNSLWEGFVSELRKGVINENLKPNLSLILRHTSGRLFEEANYIAQFGPQLDLFPSEFIKYDYHPKQVGAYFTPPPISRSIVEEAFSSIDRFPESIKIFDPACGAGEFLVESLRQLKVRGYTGRVEIIGWDIAQTALDLAKYTLTFEKREWGENLDISKLELKNSLLCKWPEGIDFIFMNPPYISWELMDSEVREQTKSIIGEKNGRPNLAAVFYYLSAQSLSESGILGCLIPSSILNSDSHKDIRNITKEMLYPQLIGRLGSYIFENAFVDTCLLIASKKQKEKYTKILWTQNVDDAASQSLRELRKQHFNGEKVTSEKNFSIYPLPIEKFLKEDSWMPLSYDSAKFRTLLEIKTSEGVFAKIESIFNVMQGARTGLNKVFIINSEIYNSYSNKEKMYFRPSVDSSSLRKGRLIKANYIFFPYSENLKEIVTEEDLKKYVPSYYKRFLKPNEKLLRERKGIDPDKWWMLTRPRRWQMQIQPKLVSTEFGKSGNFGFDKTGEYIVERGCAWFLKEETNVSHEFYFAYLAIFNSSIMDSLLHIYSRQLAGGAWYSLDSKNVGKIPLPIFHERSDQEIVSTLTEFGLRIMNEEDYDQQKLNNLVMGIYSI